jgi:hypothetical protein
MAKEYRMRVSDRLGKTRNKYRFRDDGNGLYVEVQLSREGQASGELVAKIDLEDLPIMLASKYSWRASPGGYRHYMVQSRGRRFHNILCPQWPVVDHINRDGLDNRKRNLRDGSSVNTFNKRIYKNNTTGKTGLSNVIVAGIEQWRIRWYDDEGVFHVKSFSTKKYGHDQAKKMAIEYGKNNDKLVENKNGYDSGE